MAGFVDSTVQDIDVRLSELREEVHKLEAARSALLGNGRVPARSSATRDAAAGSRRRAARGPGRPRGRRGGNTRAVQALELVRNQPGISIPQIAQEMNIEPNYLYRVLPKLVNEGKVKRDGQGWLPVE